MRLILDSGSQKTYITQQLKESLGLKPIAREKLCSKTFGADYNNLKTVDIVNLRLKNVENGLSVIITAHVVPLIWSRRERPSLGHPLSQFDSYTCATS